MTTAPHIEAMARAICAERCAFMGEPPCWNIPDVPDAEFPPKTCSEPGCVIFAQAAYDALLAGQVVEASELLNARIAELEAVLDDLVRRAYTVEGYAAASKSDALKQARAALSGSPDTAEEKP